MSRSRVVAAGHPEEGCRWSDGSAVFASGSPFPPLRIGGRHFGLGQGNNSYLFPAMGIAVFATEATRVIEKMFIVAAQALAEQVREEIVWTLLIYPPQSRILEAPLLVAERTAPTSSTTGWLGFRGRATWVAGLRRWMREMLKAMEHATGAA